MTTRERIEEIALEAEEGKGFWKYALVDRKKVEWLCRLALAHERYYVSTISAGATAQDVDEYLAALSALREARDPA
jgi:hypothetical protein